MRFTGELQPPCWWVWEETRPRNPARDNTITRTRPTSTHTQARGYTHMNEHTQSHVHDIHTLADKHCIKTQIHRHTPNHTGGCFQILLHSAVIKHVSDPPFFDTFATLAGISHVCDGLRLVNQSAASYTDGGARRSSAALTLPLAEQHGGVQHRQTREGKTAQSSI